MIASCCHVAVGVPSLPHGDLGWPVVCDWHFLITLASL